MVDPLLALVHASVARSIAAKQAFAEQSADAIVAASRMVAAALAAGGKLLIFGNGGSAADAQHIASEFVNRLERDRPALAAIALTTDSSVLTSVANDHAYERVFARQIEAIGRPGDVALAISTSGNSPNVLAALVACEERGIRTIALLGRDGGKCRPLVEQAVVVPESSTQRTQEVHILAGHLLADLVESLLFPDRS